MASALRNNGAAFTLSGMSVLVVEDEYLLAEEACQELVARGATVIGPVSNVPDALEVVASTEIDAALLDIRLQGELVFPVAKALLDRGIRFVFVTGYDALIVPDSFRDMPRFMKPVDYRVVAQARRI